MAKTRVHELAKTYGIESKEVLDKLKEMGEFVKSASSTIELPVEMKFKKTYGDALLAAEGQRQPRRRPRRRAEKPAAKKAAPTEGPRPPQPERRVRRRARGTAAAEARLRSPAPRRGARGSPSPSPRPRGRAARRPSRRGAERAQAPAGSASGGPSRCAASGQQPVRVQPGHGPSSRPAAARERRGRRTVRRVRRRGGRPGMPRPNPAMMPATRRLRHRSRARWPRWPRWSGPRWRPGRGGAPVAVRRAPGGAGAPGRGGAPVRCRCAVLPGRGGPAFGGGPGGRWRSSRSAWPDPGRLRSSRRPVAPWSQVEAGASPGVRAHGGPDDRWRARPQGQRRDRPSRPWRLADRLRREDQRRRRVAGADAVLARRDGDRDRVGQRRDARAAR